jgi:hypothetical protein
MTTHTLISYLADQKPNSQAVAVPRGDDSVDGIRCRTAGKHAIANGKIDGGRFDRWQFLNQGGSSSQHGGAHRCCAPRPDTKHPLRQRSSRPLRIRTQPLREHRQHGIAQRIA